MHNITSLLSTLITANHILHYHNILDAFGHISVRNPNTNNTFFLAKQLGPAVVQGRADIGEYSVDTGEGFEGTEGGYAERWIHSEIFKEYPDVVSVVHSHAEDVLPYTILDGTGMKPTYHMTGFLGQTIPTWDITTAYLPNSAHDLLVNTPHLGSSLAQSFQHNTTQPTSPLHTVVLQRGHGFVTWGTSIEQAVDFAYFTASNARVQTKALLLAGAGRCGGGGEGEVRYLDGQEIKDAANMNRWIVFKPWRQWVVEVERSRRYVNELGSPLM